MAITALRKYQAPAAFPSATQAITDFIASGSSTCIAATGRSVLAHLIKIVNWNKEDSVLLPAYLAEGVIRPFLQAKINIEFYRLQQNLFPDLHDIKEKITQNKTIRGCVLVHPMGFEAPVDELKMILQQKNILLIEDCAQGIFSKYANGESFGKKGDFALYSLNKFLPVADGAILISHQETIDVSPKSLLPPDDIALMHYKKHLYLNAEMTHSHDNQIIVDKMQASSDAYEKYYLNINEDLALRACSEESLTIQKHYDYAGLIEQRIKNCRYIYENLSNPNIHLVFKNYSKNTIPMALPAFLPKEKRDIWCKQLQQQGIYLATLIQRWDFIPKNQQTDFANEAEYLRSHVLIPINEFLTQTDMEKLITQLNHLN